MNPRLVAIAGPLNGRVVPLTAAEFSLGRFTSNQLSINHPSVSRRHCLIKRDGEQFRVLDLDSRNCTFVNGVPVKECALHHGDTIKVGGSYFLFLLHDEDPAATKDQLQLEDAELVSGSTISLLTADALYLQPEKLEAALPPTARVAHHLNVLFKISTVINSIQSAEALGRKLLELTFEAVPAERGAFLLVAQNSDQIGRAHV